MKKVKIPAEIAQHVPMGTRFSVEFTADGLLFKAILKEVSQAVEVPAWVNNVK